MDGPPPHEQARRPECTAPRYINDVTAAEIYESRVCDRHKQPTHSPRPATLEATRVVRLLRSTCRASTKREPVHGLRHADCVAANAPGDLLEIGSPVDKRWGTDTEPTRRIRPACSLSTQGSSENCVSTCSPPDQ